MMELENLRTQLHGVELKLMQLATNMIAGHEAVGRSLGELHQQVNQLQLTLTGEGGNNGLSARVRLIEQENTQCLKERDLAQMKLDSLEKWQFEFSGGKTTGMTILSGLGALLALVLSLWGLLKK